MKFLIKVLGAVALAYLLAFGMAVPMNPETKFWRGLSQRRDREISETRLAQPGKPMIFFAGGSSCAFSIDPAIIEKKCGMPAFNVGFPIACGAKFILHQALEKTRPGDVLVVALEPDTITYASDFAPGTLSFGLSALDGSPSASVGGSTFGHGLPIRDYLNLSRPGPGYMATWLGKSVGGKSYRYQDRDIRYHGRVETPVKMDPPDISGTKMMHEVHKDGRQVLETFAAAAKAKDVRLVYSMPWILISEAAAAPSRENNLRILQSVAQTIPSIDDGHQGVATDPDCFADTGLHLSAKGSKIRSTDLGTALQDWLAKNPR